MKVYKLLRVAISIVATLVAVPTLAGSTNAPAKDKVFLINRNGNTSAYIYEAESNALKCGSSSTSQAQYWRFVPTGTADNHYYIQNVVTGNYIQSPYTAGRSNAVTTGTTPVEFQIALDNTSGASTNGFYYMCSTDQGDINTTSDSGDNTDNVYGTLGLNFGSSGVVAYWIKTGRGNSYWNISETTYAYSGSDALTSYTASATVTYDGGEATTLSNQKVEVSSDGMKMIYRNFTIGSNVIGDLTVSGVTATTSDGTTTYELTSGSATLSNYDYNLASTYNITEGATIPLAITGTYDATNGFKAKFTATVNSKEAVVLYNGYTTPRPSTTPTITAGEKPTGTVISVVDDNYASGGNIFTKSVTIDWDKQKLVAYIDASSAYSGNYNVFNVGQDYTSTSYPNIYVTYYKTNKTFSVYSDGMTSGSSNIYVLNKSLGNDNHTIRIEISKDKGVYVNDQDCNYVNSTQITDPASNFSALWALTTVQVSNKNAGNSVSQATYKYIRILDKDSSDDNGVPLLTTPVTFAESEEESESSTSTISTYSNKYLADLTLTRTLTADEWNTFCVPFSVYAEGMSGFGENFEIKKFKEVSGNSMILENATSIEAGQPYLVRPKTKDIKNPKFVNAQITEVSPATNVSNNSTFNFIGVYGKHTFTSDNASTSYILVSGGNLVNPQENTTMKGMRAYFTYTKTGQVAPRVVIDGVETALTEVISSEEISDGRIYNLRGMYVGNDESKLAKGVYIMNGKKIVLK